MSADRLAADGAHLAGRLARMIQIGTVMQVDADLGVRVALGGGVSSPWLPHPESGGQIATWQPLSEGQIVAIFSPNGDVSQGVLMRAGYSGMAPPPTDDLEQAMWKGLGFEVAAKDGGLELKAKEEVTIRVGNSTVTISDNEISLDSPKVRIPKVEIGVARVETAYIETAHIKKLTGGAPS